MIRVVGNVVDSTVFASMHYAVSHLNVPLVVVLGHTGCGAVNAAINDNANGLIKPTIENKIGYWQRKGRLHCNKQECYGWR